MTESAEALIGAIGRLVNEERVLCVCDRVCCGAKLRATACHALAHKLSLNIVYALQYHSVLSCILARPLRSGLGEGLPRQSLGVLFVGERPRFALPPAGGLPHAPPVEPTAAVAAAASCSRSTSSPTSSKTSSSAGGGGGGAGAACFSAAAAAAFLFFNDAAVAAARFAFGISDARPRLKLRQVSRDARADHDKLLTASRARSVHEHVGCRYGRFARSTATVNCPLVTNRS